MVTQLDLLLEKYGNIMTKQAVMPVDWHADPRSFNGTWEPWLSPNEVIPNAATALSTLAVCAHIGMVLLIVGLRAFIWLKDTFPGKNTAAKFYRSVKDGGENNDDIDGDHRPENLDENYAKDEEEDKEDDNDVEERDKEALVKISFIEDD